MTRPLSDLADDLASDADFIEKCDLGLNTTRMRSAAAAIALLAEHLPAPACDTCGGDGEEPIRFYGDHEPRPCPDPFCDAGRLELGEWLRRVAAVWAAVQGPTLYDHLETTEQADRFLTGWFAAYDHLREVGRQG